MAYFLKPGDRVWLGLHKGTVRKVLVRPAGGRPGVQRARYLIEDERNGRLVAKSKTSLTRAS